MRDHSVGLISVVASQSRRRRATSQQAGLELHIVTSSDSAEVTVRAPLLTGLAVKTLTVTKGNVAVVQLSRDYAITDGTHNNRGNLSYQPS